MNYNTRKMKKKNVTTIVYNDIDTFRVAVKTKSSGIYFLFFHKKSGGVCHTSKQTVK